MDQFTAAELLPSGELKTLAGEQKTLNVLDVTLSPLPKTASLPTFSSGVLIITTHRLAWTTHTRSKAYSIPLSTLRTSKTLESSSSLRGARAELNFASGSRVRVDFSGAGGRENRERARNAVSASLTRAQWVVDARIAAQQKAAAEREAAATAAASVTASRAGIGGAVAAVQARSNARDAAITSGFASLDDLRATASQLVQIARALQGSPAGKSGGSDNELLDMMAAAGIEAPVTKASVSGGGIRFYREEVAREVATFLADRLPLLGGVMTLPDAYCLVTRNRASAELVSPGDFGAACGMIEGMGLGLRVVTLGSGVRAVQMERGDTRGAQQLREMAEECAVGAVDVVRKRHVPLKRALEMLKEAEGAGVLARDETDGVLRFFPNRFGMLLKGQLGQVEGGGEGER